MMFATVVLAHKNPMQVRRLAERLAPHPVLVHVDARVPASTAAAFSDSMDGLAHVTRISSRRTAWASWGLVDAALDGIEAALRIGGWTHVQLLSGQDYPLRPATEIAALLAEHSDQSFVSNWALPTPLWGKRGGMDRVQDVNFAVFGRRVRIPWRRRVPAGLRVHGGSMYWQLNEAAAAAIMGFRSSQPDWMSFLRRSWIPDELTVPSLLQSHPLAATCVNENLTFIRWSRPGSAHPDLLSTQDIAALVAASRGASDVGGQARAKLFARKFDSDQDSRVLDLIDEQCLLVPSRRTSDEASPTRPSPGASRDDEMAS